MKDVRQYDKGSFGRKGRRTSYSPQCFIVDFTAEAEAVQLWA